jgi:hypothetical protein
MLPFLSWPNGFVALHVTQFRTWDALDGAFCYSEI